MGRHEMRWEELRWDELRWSASVKCGVWGVKIAMWSVKKVFTWRCIAPGSRWGHVLGHQQRNRFAQSTHERAWLAHAACKFYRWERSYNITLRQLPPRLVRVILVFDGIYIGFLGFSGIYLVFLISRITWIPKLAGDIPHLYRRRREPRNSPRRSGCQVR